MNCDRQKLKQELTVDEGSRRLPYRDTVGKWTIGIGRNLSDVGLSAEERVSIGAPIGVAGPALVAWLGSHPLTDPQIDLLLEHDLDRTIAALERACPWVAQLDEPRSRALCNMAFNLGIGGLLMFHRFLAAMQAHDWAVAAVEAMNSTWATQVGARAQRIARALVLGEL
jgi:lysozyme